MGPAWLGVAFVVLAAVLLSLKGIFAKLLYAQGLDVITVAGVRSALAVPGFWLLALWQLGPRRLLGSDRRAMAIAAIAGIGCYYVGAYLDFFALTMIDASVERVLLFSYPVMTVTFQALLSRRWPPPTVLAALGIAYPGVFLVMGGFDSQLMRSNAFGSSLVLIAAASVAMYYMVIERVGHLISSQAFTVYAMTAAGAAMSAHLLSAHDLTDLAMGREAWGLMLSMVVVATVLPLFLLAEGVHRIGAARGSLISLLGPPSTVVVAWCLLGEQLRASQWLGSGAIIAGVVVVEWGVRRQAKADRAINIGLSPPPP